MKSCRVALKIIILTFVGCGAWLAISTGTGSRGKGHIYVAAAASLAEAMEHVGREFQRSHGIDVRIDLGSSGLLRRKIEMGIPMDVFVSASSRDMDLLERSNFLLAETRQDILINSLVCLVPSDSPWSITSARDLLQDHIRWVAIGNPEHVPAGMYAKQALGKLGLWEQLSKKLAICIDVRAVSAQVEAATAQAAIVYKTDVDAVDKARIAFAFPPSTYEPIVYPGSVLKVASRVDDAKAFLSFLNSAQAARIFRANGFQVIRNVENRTICGIMP